MHYNYLHLYIQRDLPYVFVLRDDSIKILGCLSKCLSIFVNLTTQKINNRTQENLWLSRFPFFSLDAVPGCQLKNPGLRVSTDKVVDIWVLNGTFIEGPSINVDFSGSLVRPCLLVFRSLNGFTSQPTLSKKTETSQIKQRQYTPWKFASSPLKIYHPKRKFIFQPSI